MEGIKRTAFQGVTNIIRFNWHFYVIAFVALLVLFFTKQFLSPELIFVVNVFILLSFVAIFISLAASYYIYDRSNLYSLDWLNFLQIAPFTQIVNINAGFDETSALLEQKYQHSTLQVFDFYDAAKHTEVSIERARKAYPTYPGTQTINTNAIPLKENSTDCAFLILAAHEIRNTKERIAFFKQLQTALTSTGKIVVVEHLQDLPNFIAYNFGFFHFHSKATWLKAFEQSNLIMEKEIKITPFISTFILCKNGATS
ncbi:MAG: methyltransferase [Bacteroidia bacterium]